MTTVIEFGGNKAPAEGSACRGGALTQDDVARFAGEERRRGIASCPR